MAIESVSISNTMRYVNDTAINRGSQVTAGHAKQSTENMTHATQFGQEMKSGTSEFQKSNASSRRETNAYVSRKMSESTENMEHSDPFGHMEKAGQSQFQRTNKEAVQESSRFIATAMKEASETYKEASNYRSPSAKGLADA